MFGNQRTIVTKRLTKTQEKKLKKLWSDFAKAETKYHAAWRKAVDYEDMLVKTKVKTA